MQRRTEDTLCAGRRAFCTQVFPVQDEWNGLSGMQLFQVPTDLDGEIVRIAALAVGKFALAFRVYMLASTVDQNRESRSSD